MILSSLGQPPVVAATLGAAFLNYFLFFYGELRAYLGSLKLGMPTNPKATLFKQTRDEAIETLHRCEACGRTELSHPDLDFRVTASGAEYCSEHLAR